MLEVDTQNIECVALGEMAEDLSGVPSGMAVTVTGNLSCHDGISEIVIENLIPHEQTTRQFAARS